MGSRSARRCCDRVRSLLALRVCDSGSNTYYADIKLDPGFKDFYKWCKENDIPVIIVSSYVSSLVHPAFPLTNTLRVAKRRGMTPTIRAVLSNLVGEQDAAEIDIISNDVTFDGAGRWHIQYRHPSRYVSSCIASQTSHHDIS
jgi:2-hydroxy-3-keto-5-methylthiopentenyl-1-phosphate phosphatase